MPAETIEVSQIVADLLINMPTLAGLVLLVIALYRMNQITREEKNEEIQRLQQHNDKLMNWCRGEPEDRPPLTG